MNPMLENFMQSIPLPAPIANIAKAMEMYRQFSDGFQGDPQAQVQQLLQSGQMTQEQYQQYQVWAKRLYPLLRNR